MNKELGPIGPGTLRLLEEMGAKAVRGGEGMNFSSILYPEYGLVELKPRSTLDSGWLKPRANALRQLAELAQNVPEVRVPRVFYEDQNYLLMEMARGISLYQGTYTSDYLEQHAQIPTQVKLNLLHSYFEVVEAANALGHAILDHKSDSVFIEWDPNNLPEGGLWIVDPGGVQRPHPDLKNAALEKLRKYEIALPPPLSTQGDTVNFIESFFIAGYSTTEGQHFKYHDAIPWPIRKACISIEDGTISSTNDLWPFLSNVSHKEIDSADEIREWYWQKINNRITSNLSPSSENQEEQNGSKGVSLETYLGILEHWGQTREEAFDQEYLHGLIGFIQDHDEPINEEMKQRIINIFRHGTTLE